MYKTAVHTLVNGAMTHQKAQMCDAGRVALKHCFKTVKFFTFILFIPVQERRVN